jgi:hypothetical protein
LDDIGLGPGSMLLLKVLGSIFSGANLAELIYLLQKKYITLLVG